MNSDEREKTLGASLGEASKRGSMEYVINALLRDGEALRPEIWEELVPADREALFAELVGARGLEINWERLFNYISSEEDPKGVGLRPEFARLRVEFRAVVDSASRTFLEQEENVGRSPESSVCVEVNCRGMVCGMPVFRKIMEMWAESEGLAVCQSLREEAEKELLEKGTLVVCWNCCQ